MPKPPTVERLIAQAAKKAGLIGDLPMAGAVASPLSFLAAP